jgi:hypothetical protein
MPDDESEVPSFSIDQSKRCRQNIGNQVTTAPANQQQQQQHQTQRASSNVIESEAEFS